MTFIFPPDVLASRTVRYAEYLKNTPGVKFGVPSVDKVMIPMKPGEAIGIIGRPGSGKSSVMSAVARNTAYEIAKSGEGTVGPHMEGRAVLYSSWEQLVETQDFGVFQSLPGNRDINITDIHWGRADMREMKARSVKRPQLPIWIAGTSHADLGKPRPKMYIDALFDDIVETYHKYNVKFDLVCLDYLQLIPVRKGRSRSEEVSEAVKNSKYLAQELGCPVLLGVQAKASVDATQDKVPTMGDAYYTSELEHDVDKGFGIMRPAKYWQVGGVYEIKTQNDTIPVPITPELMIMWMWKQRGDSGSHRFIFHFDVSTLTFEELELKRHLLNP